MKFHHVPPFVQELPSGSNGPARWSESMEKMYGPPPRGPQGFSQLDADTESKKNAIGLVMASGLDYKRAVELLEYCEGDVELALNKLEKAQIRESTNDVRKPPQPHAVRAIPTAVRNPYVLPQYLLNDPSLLQENYAVYSCFNNCLFQQLVLFSSTLQSLLGPWLLDPQDSSIPIPVPTGCEAPASQTLSDGIFEPWPRKKGMGRAMLSQQFAPWQWDDPTSKKTKIPSKLYIMPCLYGRYNKYT